LQRIRTSKKVLYLYCVLSLLGCTQKGPPSAQQLKEVALQTNRTTVDLVFWGDLKGQIDTCSCSLQPLGGLHRLKKHLTAEKTTNPDTLFFSTGGLFNETSTEAESKMVLDFESSFAKSAAVLRATDTEHIQKKKIAFNKENFLLLGEEKKLRYKDKLDLHIRPLDNAETYSKLYKSLVPSTLNIYLSTMSLGELDRLPAPKEATLEVFLGSSSSDADEFKCFSRKQRLFCQGGQKGRSIAHLKLNILSVQNDWSDYGVLTFNAESVDFFNQQKEESANKTAALKALSETFKDGWKTSNFFTLKSVYMNNVFGN